MHDDMDKMRDCLLEEADYLVEEGHDRSSQRLQNIAKALKMSMDDLMEGRE